MGPGVEQLAELTEPSAGPSQAPLIGSLGPPRQRGLGSASTGSASTGSASTGSASTGSASTGSASTGSASTGSASTGSASTGSASAGAAAPSIHPGSWIAPGAVVVGSVTIGRDSSIWYGSVLRADDDEIFIGEQCNIQDLCCLHVDEGEPARLEPRVSLGHHATVHGAHIEEGALIGMGAVVLGGATVGAGSLIAAGAVVLPGHHVPAGVLFAGVPGRVVRELNDIDHERISRTWQSYVDRARRHREARWHQVQPY